MSESEVTPATVHTLALYEVTLDQIREMGKQYAALNADTPEDREQLRKAIAVIRTTRVAIEERRKERIANALATQRAFNAGAKELTAALVEIEDPLKQKRDAYEAEKAREKAEKEAAERAAVTAALKAEQEEAEAKRRAAIEEEERQRAALRAADEARLQEERAALEVERQRMAAEQAKLDAERKAERDRIATEERARAAEREREQAELQAQRDEIARQRAAVEREEAVRLAKAQAEEAERARVERERVAAEEARVAEAERRARFAALRSDVEKVQGLARALRDVIAAAPEVKSEEAREVIAAVRKRVYESVEFLEDFGGEASGDKAAE